MIKKIIKEEVENIIQEQSNNKLIQNMKDIFVPKIAMDPIATKIFKLTYKGFKDKKISINDFYGVTSALYTAIDTGNKEFAHKALSQNNALKKLGIDIEIGDITQKVGDPSRASNMPLPDKLKDSQIDFGKTYGINFKLNI